MTVRSVFAGQKLAKIGNFLREGPGLATQGLGLPQLFGGRGLAGFHLLSQIPF